MYMPCVYFFIYLLSMLHYSAVTLHAVIYMLASFAGDTVTNIVASDIALPLQF
jgi:hypothetical protein